MPTATILADTDPRAVVWAEKGASDAGPLEAAGAWATYDVDTFARAVVAAETAAGKAEPYVEVYAKGGAVLMRYYPAPPRG